jgi:tungstate transport system ATP-binding protein
MGPNGSGKSTFLRICALIEEPDNGEVNYYSVGLPVNKDIGLRRRITLLLPKIGVFNTTVYNNVAYGLKIRGLSGQDIEKKVIRALDFVVLSHKKTQRALTLSSGETQRMGIARALAIEPEILFLDEPTASVDLRNTEIIEEIIYNIHCEGKTAIIMATHNASQAEKIAGRILLMENRQIIEKSV